jgi:hypothetical protein
VSKIAESKILTPEFMKKVKRLRFSMIPTEVWVLVETLRQLPEDSVMVNQGQDFNTMCWNIFVASDKFESVPEGQMTPEIAVKVNTKKKTVELAIPMGPENFLSELNEL